MQVTDVKIRKVVKYGKMKAVASVTLNDMLVIHDVRIIDGSRGLFVAMPSRRTSTGEFRDVTHPINQEARGLIEGPVIEAYHQALLYQEDYCSQEEDRGVGSFYHDSFILQT